MSRYKTIGQFLSICLIALWAAMPVPAGSQFNGCQSGFCSGGSSGGGGGPCSQATTFVARTTLSVPEAAAITTMICGMVSDGTGCSSWGAGGTLDALYILAVNTTTNASLNLCSTSFTLTTHGTPTAFTPNVGYNGDASTFYLDTGYVPSTAGGNYQQNSATLAVYVPGNRTAPQIGVEIGASNGAISAYAYFQPLASGNLLGAELNSGTFPTIANTDVIGAWVVSRTGSAGFSIYKNDNLTPFVTFTDASAGLPNASIIIFGFQDSSTGVTDLSADLISAAFFGGGQTAAHAIALNNRINTYISTINLGLNIY